jgi:hypothetical protein
LDPAEVALPRYLGWSERDRGSAALTLDFKRILCELLQLLRTNVKVLFKCVLLYGFSTGGDSLLMTAERTRKKTVFGFVEEVSSARRARITMNSIQDDGGNLHALSCST